MKEYIYNLVYFCNSGCCNIRSLSLLMILGSQYRNLKDLDCCMISSFYSTELESSQIHTSDRKRNMIHEHSRTSMNPSHPALMYQKIIETTFIDSNIYSIFDCCYTSLQSFNLCMLQKAFFTKWTSCFIHFNEQNEYACLMINTHNIQTC